MPPPLPPADGAEPGARSALVWDLVQQAVRLAVPRSESQPGSESAGSEPGSGSEGQPVDVLDVGGGTGGFAVPLAAGGHRVVVIDPSPDALASLQRRAREEAVDVTALQGDAAGLLDVVAPQSADLVLCHGVLEHVDDVPGAVGNLATVLRPGGVLSLLAASRTAVVLARAIAGRFAEARHALVDPDGRWGEHDPLPRRFTEPALRALLDQAGLQVETVHGVRVVSDLVPGALAGHDAVVAEELRELERLASEQPDLRAVAGQLHLLARKPPVAVSGRAGELPDKARDLPGRAGELPS